MSAQTCGSCGVAIEPVQGHGWRELGAPPGGVCVVTGKPHAPAPFDAEYSWAYAARDLALTTSLDLRGALDVLTPFQLPDPATGTPPPAISPADAVDLVQRIVHGLRGEHGGTTAAAGLALRRLAAGEAWPR